MKSLIDMRNGAKIDGTNYKLLLKHIRLNVTDKYEFPPEIIKVNGTTVATLGNFSASTGKPKSKKTFNVSALVASALSGKEVLKYKTILPQGKERILYVDTEQSKCHCHKVMQRIMKLAGLPVDKEDDRILFFVLREYTPEQRREIISCALQEEENIGLVIIDGIRDLIRDFIRMSLGNRFRSKHMFNFDFTHIKKLLDCILIHCSFLTGVNSRA